MFVPDRMVYVVECPEMDVLLLLCGECGEGEGGGVQ